MKRFLVVIIAALLCSNVAQAKSLPPYPHPDPLVLLGKPHITIFRTKGGKMIECDEWQFHIAKQKYIPAGIVTIDRCYSIVLPHSKIRPKAKPSVAKPKLKVPAA